MENFFGLMKSELLYPGKYTSMEVFIKDLKEQGLRDRYIGSLFRVDEPVPDDSR